LFEDRRQYGRTKEFVKFRIVSGGNERNFVTTDISPTGAFFASAVAPDVGETVTIVARPGGMKVAPIEIEAVVVRRVELGSATQPGFAVRWVVARTEAGGEPLYRVLKKVLRVSEVTLEMFGHERDAEFHFPEIGERFGKVLQIDNTPRGPLLQSRKEEKRSGPPKAPPPVQTPIETLSSRAETLAPLAEDRISTRRDPPGRRSTNSGRFKSATTRASAFKTGGRRRSGTSTSDDIMAGAGALRHRDSDVTHIGGRSRSLQAKRTEEAASPGEVTIMDNIRIDPIGLVGKTRTEKLVERAKQKEQQEQKANVGERSQIFGKSARLSSLGGRSMSTTIRGGAQDEVEHASVSVDIPVTYEIDNRFIPATLIQAAPLALEVVAQGAVPQLDRNLCINMPVPIDGLYRTIYLMGKLLRVPEEKDEGKVFVFHIERVHEGEYEGAFTNFLAEQQQAAAAE